LQRRERGGKHERSGVAGGKECPQVFTLKKGALPVVGNKRPLVGLVFWVSPGNKKKKCVPC